MTDNNSQYKISVYFVDTTYGQEGDGWEAKSAALKTKLEAE
jgi:hypothetical protein